MGSVVVSGLLSVVFSSNSELKEAGKIGTWCMHAFFVYVLSTWYTLHGSYRFNDEHM